MRKILLINRYFVEGRNASRAIKIPKGTNILTGGSHEVLRWLSFLQTLTGWWKPRCTRHQTIRWPSGVMDCGRDPIGIHERPRWRLGESVGQANKHGGHIHATLAKTLECNLPQSKIIHRKCPVCMCTWTAYRWLTKQFTTQCTDRLVGWSEFLCSFRRISQMVSG